MIRRAAKRDANQEEIAGIWRARGWRVVVTSWAGQHCPGFPDMLATRWPLTVWIEVKSPGGRVGRAQSEFRAALSAPYVVCRDGSEALRLAELWRERADMFAACLDGIW